MKIFFVCLVISLVGISTHANETAGGGAGTKQLKSESALPKCVDNPEEVQNILDIEKQNSKNEFKYKGFRTSLATDTDEDLVNRIVYSEALAANCPEHNDKLLPLIKAVVTNRIHVKKNTRAVVFQVDQFASSLNNYTPSRYRDFLCPKNTSLWRKTQSAQAFDLPPDIFNYYLYQHAPEKFKLASGSWPTKTPIEFTGSKELENCIKFFNKLPYH